MARTRNPEAHARRRDEFLDAAEQLIARKGYEQFSIQDVLDATGASKGAFYHYFGSKADLLDAAVDRMTILATTSLEPLVADPSLAAVDKLNRVFSEIATYKAARKDLLLGLIHAWMSDDNVVVREKFRRRSLPRIGPLFTRIIEQGCVEGVFETDAPADTARVLVGLMQGSNEAATELFLALEAGTASITDVERILNAYAHAFERILGARRGSITFVDPAVLREWFDPQ